MDALARRGLSVLLCLAALGILPVQAQTPSMAPEWHYSEGHLLDVYTKDQIPTWERTLGIAGSIEAKYEGGDAYKPSGGPTFDIRYRDLAFFSAGEGVGINLLHTKTARAGVAVSYDLGRNNESDHFLNGMGNLGIAPSVKVFAEYLLFPVTFRADLRHYFGGYGGYAGDLSVYMPLGGKKDVFFIFAGPSLTFGDADYLRHAFGVDAAQSANSGYPVHALGGGIRSYSFGVSGGYYFTKRIIWEAFVAGEQLIGGAGSSPIAQERGQLGMQTALVYRW